jgi:hypothetical protein
MYSIFAKDTLYFYSLIHTSAFDVQVLNITNLNLF